jgi:hypothetical protein
MTWLPQSRLVPQKSWQLWRARDDLETLENFFDRLELPIYVNVLVVWPAGTTAAETSTVEAPCREQLTALANIQFMTQQCRLTPYELLKQFSTESEKQAEPMERSEGSKGQRRTIMKARSTTSGNERKPGRFTALALHSSRLLAIDARGRFLLHLEEDAYRRLGLIGQGHRTRLGRKRQRQPVYGDGALVRIDLNQVCHRPGSKYQERVQNCLQRLSDTFLWQLTALDGSTSPTEAALGVMQKIPSLVRTGTTTSFFTREHRRALANAFRGHPSTDWADVAEAMSNVMDAIGQLMLGSTEPPRWLSDAETRYYLRPLSADTGQTSLPKKDVAFQLFEWGTDNESLLPHRWYKQILPIVWTLHSLGAQTTVDVFLYARYQAQPAEAKSDKIRIGPSIFESSSSNVVGFFGRYHEQEALVTETSAAVPSGIPFLVFDQP